tara:strand:- start:1762 stop:3057 length:1296 start_codon:yes stop_codon:yes gene_type:complete
VSRQSQQRFLEKLIDEVGGPKIEAYRRATADRQHHNFTLTRRGVRKGMRDYLTKDNPDMPKATKDRILKAIDPSVKAFLKKVGDNLVALAARDETVKVIKNTAATKHASFEVKNGKSRYDKIYSRYSAELKLLSEQFSDVVGETVRSQDIVNLSHANLEGIIESAVADAIDKAVEQDSLITLNIAREFLKGRGVDLSVIRDTKTSTMSVSLDSAVLNAEDKDYSKARIKELRKALIQAMEELSRTGLLIDLPGSDSFDTLKKKKIVNDTLDPFRKIKNTKVSKRKKIKHAKTTTENKKKGGKAKVSVVAAKARRASSARKKKAGIAAQPLQLIGLINKELPDTVKKNMKEPALVNRSGRFAESVRLTEVIQTPQGFPSFGYTYQRNPYQVFEEGSSGSWSNGQRDPRVLIDKSIREIAAQFALGRFYTRRV